MVKMNFTQILKTLKFLISALIPIYHHHCPNHQVLLILQLRIHFMNLQMIQYLQFLHFHLTGFPKWIDITSITMRSKTQEMYLLALLRKPLEEESENLKVMWMSKIPCIYQTCPPCSPPRYQQQNFDISQHSITDLTGSPSTPSSPTVIAGCTSKSKQ